MPADRRNATICALCLSVMQISSGCVSRLNKAQNRHWSKHYKAGCRSAATKRQQTALRKDHYIFIKDKTHTLQLYLNVTVKQRHSAIIHRYCSQLIGLWELYRCKHTNMRMGNPHSGSPQQSTTDLCIHSNEAQLCMSERNERLSRSVDGDRGRSVTMAFSVCGCVCARGWGGGQDTEEMQRQTTHNCGKRFKFPVPFQENYSSGVFKETTTDPFLLLSAAAGKSSSERPVNTVSAFT